MSDAPALPPLLLVIPLPGLLRVVVDGKVHDKPINRDQALQFAQAFLKAAIEGK
jgi:hypothetical protein